MNERRKTEKHSPERYIPLKETSGWLESLIQTIPDVVYVKDVEGRNLVVNQAFADLVGLSIPEIIGRTDDELFPPQLADYCRRSDRQVFEQRLTVRSEEEFTDEAGRKVVFDTLKTPFLDASGRVVGLVGVSRDISDRKRMEAALQKVNEDLEERIGERTRVLLGMNARLTTEISERRGMEKVLYRVNRALKTRSEFNQAMLRTETETGLLQEICRILVEVGGYRMAWVGFAEQDADQSVRPVAQAGVDEGYLEGARVSWGDSERGRGPTGTAIRTGKICINHNILENPDFDPWRRAAVKRGYASSISIPLVLEGDRIGSLNIYAVESDAFDAEEVELLAKLSEDLTYGIKTHRLGLERKQIEEALRHSQTLLLQSQKMEAVGRLAGGIAHDFNNLLTGILGYCELLREGLGAGHSLGRYAEEITKAAERGALLTDQLLTFSRKKVLEPEALDLNEVIVNLDGLLRRLISEDIELITRPGPDLGLVRMDRSQMEQIIVNLVVNARDAMPLGGRLEIETETTEREAPASGLSGTARERCVTLTVRDTGVGMDPETQSHIFEPFFTTKEVGKGTGLGLFTVYGIVAQHGGRIEVQSAREKGAVFQIHLPRIAPPQGVPESSESFEETPSGWETVLVVEDDAGVRRLIYEGLHGKGYRILEAAHGEEALEIVRRTGETPIHLIVTDVVMPGMSGFELVRRMKGERPEIKVLFISGYAEDANDPSRTPDPQVPFLQKPFTPQTLARKVREVLDHSPS